MDVFVIAMRRFIALLFLLAACSAPESIRLDDDSAIREAVFRYQFKYYKDYLGEKTDFYCIGLTEDSNPPPQLMRRFDRLGIPVVPVSECKIASKMLGSVPVGGKVIHGSLKGIGLILRAGEIRKLNSVEVEVEGGYYGGGRAASGNTYLLRVVSGQWQVINDRENWVS